MRLIGVTLRKKSALAPSVPCQAELTSSLVTTDTYWAQLEDTEHALELEVFLVWVCILMVGTTKMQGIRVTTNSCWSICVGTRPNHTGVFIDVLSYITAILDKWGNAI